MNANGEKTICVKWRNHVARSGLEDAMLAIVERHRNRSSWRHLPLPPR